MIFPRISRFERRIILAIFLCALVPFLISLIFIPQIIESRLALSMHSGVKTQLEASAVFFSEFFKAEAYHQEYYRRNTAQPYCQVVIRPKVAKFRQKFSHRLKA